MSGSPRPWGLGRLLFVTTRKVFLSVPSSRIKSLHLSGLSVSSFCSLVVGSRTSVPSSPTVGLQPGTSMCLFTKVVRKSRVPRGQRTYVTTYSILLCLRHRREYPDYRCLPTVDTTPSVRPLPDTQVPTSLRVHFGVDFRSISRVQLKPLVFRVEYRLCLV